MPLKSRYLPSAKDLLRAACAKSPNRSPQHSQWQLLRHRGNSSEGGDKHYKIDTKDIRRNLSIRSSLGPGLWG
jgi:hypothetical protein|uniref:ORF72 n=1 Tax=Oryza sativa subsp. japonica TaxID=39947 RepID=Q35307_ORYSJ|nr:ORF72 [Oryza sativa Japonica Group]